MSDAGSTTEISLKLKLSNEAQSALRKRASEAGREIEEYASQLLEQAVRAPSLEEVLEPLRNEFLRSGMTEDELGDVLEQAKHEMRAERAARRAS